MHVLKTPYTSTSKDDLKIHTSAEETGCIVEFLEKKREK